MNDLLQTDKQSADGSVECLGMTFPSENARREHFLKLLAEKLKNPHFRNQVGFPQGADEAILAMSDPPYYTACPNPWLEDFVKHYGKSYDPAEEYSREPMAIDVSVGKTHPIYKAHSYHTKVPHLAIVPSILHFTEPGDVVLDGFAGSGMTGVAAQWCGTAPASYRHQLEMEWKKAGMPAPKWGARRSVLNDLSPAATFIGANYNLPFDVDAFAKAGKQLLAEVEHELRWMYETLHSDGITKGRIEYTVWSEVFACPECAGEIVFLDEALDEETKRVRDAFPCPSCGAQLTKRKLERLYIQQIDPATGEIVPAPKRVATEIAYKIGKTRLTKKPDKNDVDILRRVAEMPIPEAVPTQVIPAMHMTHERARMDYSGITNVHQFFLPRAVQALAALWSKAKAHPVSRLRSMLLFAIEQSIWGFSLQNRYRLRAYSHVNQYLTGVYYVPSQCAEPSPSYNVSGKLERLTKAFRNFNSIEGNAVVNTGTAADLDIPDATIDYVFTDPPFGENIYYADLNYLVESWHGVTTDAKPEAIIDRFKKKRLPDYQHQMQKCFAEYHRVLKPGRWMTVVFSNSKASVWNAIQVAL